MTKEEFQEIIQKPYSGYLSYDEHVMDNTMLSHLQYLRDFNGQCEYQNTKFLGFCKAPLSAGQFDHAMVFENQETFNLEWFHIGKWTIHDMIENFLEYEYDNPKLKKLYENFIVKINGNVRDLKESKE
jgi:hypothetical protein